jgi:hypothetical protein
MVQQERQLRYVGTRVFVLVCALMIMSIPANAVSSSSPTAGGDAKPTLTFNPTSVSVGDAYTVEGAGFPANTWVAVAAYYSNQAPDWGCCSVITDGSGNITVSFIATESGHVRHVAETQASNGRLHREAHATLVVDSALASA